MTDHFWSDASTINCVWLFQLNFNDHGEYKRWMTERVFLTQEEAVAHGESRPYAYGKKDKGWRIYGVPCDGIMAELLGRHTDEFADKVERIVDREKESYQVKTDTKKCEECGAETLNKGRNHRFCALCAKKRKDAVFRESSRKYRKKKKVKKK